MFEKSDAILHDIHFKREQSKALFNEAVALKQVYIRELVQDAQHLKNNWIVMRIDGNDHFFHCRSIQTAPIVNWLDPSLRDRGWNMHTDYVEMYFDYAGCIIDGYISYQEFNKVAHNRYSPEEIRSARIASGDDMPVLNQILSTTPISSEG